MNTPSGQSTRRIPSLDGLSSTAKSLTEASRKLTSAIEKLNGALKKLNLGITAWISTQTLSGVHVIECEEIGYARYKGTWGVCIRQTIEGHDPEPEQTIWHFDDAPRDMRISGAEHLYELVAKLDEIAKETTQKITERVTDTEELATTIDAIANDARVKAKLYVKGGQQ